MFYETEELKKTRIAFAVAEGEAVDLEFLENFIEFLQKSQIDVDTEEAHLVFKLVGSYSVVHTAEEAALIEEWLLKNGVKKSSQEA